MSTIEVPMEISRDECRNYALRLEFVADGLNLAFPLKMNSVNTFSFFDKGQITYTQARLSDSVINLLFVINSLDASFLSSDMPKLE